MPLVQIINTMKRLIVAMEEAELAGGSELKAAKAAGEQADNATKQHVLPGDDKAANRMAADAGKIEL